jgi:DNA-binding CsgD family transcriptional regulator
MHSPFTAIDHATSVASTPTPLGTRHAVLDLRDSRRPTPLDREPAWRGRTAPDPEALARVIGAMRTGVVLVDVEGTVAYLNHTAREALGADIGLALRGDRVSATSPDARRKLTTALGHACRPPFIDSALLLSPGHAEYAPRPLRVLSFERLAGTNRAVDVSLALLCVPAVRRRAPDPMLLSQLFGLTPAEAALMSGIASGARLHQCAAQRGVSLATVRAQLRNVFVKTGAATQADLTLIAWSIPGLGID